MLAANGAPIHIIKDQHSFDEHCIAWSSQSQLAFDTEFIRTNTFYPILGLLQIADASACYLVDPLQISLWDNFKRILEQGDLQFSVHSCGEDLNLLHTSIQSMPHNLFDTQIAAAFLGLGFSISYQALVNLLLGQEIPKDETRSDWLRRPLSDTQLQYAANDVCYLLNAQACLTEQLSSKNMLSWFEEECGQQQKIAINSEDSSNWSKAYSNISNAWKLNDDELGVLQQLCYWRESKARKKDKPKSWIVKDNDLFSLSKIQFSSGQVTMNDLRDLSFKEYKWIGRYGEEIVDILNSPNQELTAVDRTTLSFPLKPELRKRLKSCQTVVATVAEKLSIAPELLARKRLLQDLIRDYDTFGKLAWKGELGGWRREILEPEISTFFT